MPGAAHAGGMYTITASQAMANEDLWAVLSALRLLDDAIDAVGTATTDAVRIRDDAQWHNQGMRKLRWALADLSGALGVECRELEFQRDQVWRAVAA